MFKVAAIGSRDITKEDEKKIECLSFLKGKVWIRSGGAPGADVKWDEVLGETGKKEIFLPGKYFNYFRVKTKNDFYDASEWFNEKTWEITEQFHPNPKALKYDFVKALMQRNIFQVLGRDMNDPVAFVLCVADGTKFDTFGKIKDVSGGTGQAVRIAHHHNIPVVNIRDGNGWNNLPKEHQWIYNQYLYNLRNYDKLKEMV